MLRNGVQAIAHVTHVVREEAHHQLFNLLLVFVVHGMHVHVDGDELRHGTYLTLLFHCFEVAVNHGEKFQRVHFLAIVLDFHVEHVGTHSNHLTCLYHLSVVGKDIAQMGIGHFIVAVADDLIDTMNGIIPQS